MLERAGRGTEEAADIPPVLRAEDFVDLERYSAVNVNSLPLVATIDNLVEGEITNPAIVEIGPVPTDHYDLMGGFPTVGGQYNLKQAFIDAIKDTGNDFHTPPIRYLAEAHPDWHLAAISPHDIPEESKQALLGPHAGLFMRKLGPERDFGLNPEDVWDEGYQNGEDISRFYPDLLKQLGGKRPDIIFGRHVFDYSAEKYPVDKLTTVASMLLPVGGSLVSHVHRTDADNSRVPLGDDYFFPFDSSVNMQLTEVMSFKGDSLGRRHVFVYKKVADSIRSTYKNKRNQ